MSEKQYYLVAGVVKFDFKSVGYKDLFQVTQKWIKDNRFKQIIIRFVSETNLGIQFLYIDDQFEKNTAA